jgi:carbon storage regulator
MLVLSRQRDETIMIGDDIEITVVDIRGDKVRVGITAPTRIAVHRKEIWEAIKAENQRAATVGDGDLESLGRSLERVAQRAPGGGGPGLSRRLAAGGRDDRSESERRACG